MRIAKWCFGQVSAGRGVDVGGLVQLRKHLSQALGIPEAAFGSMQRQHLRFNVDGTGRLNENELYKLMKMNLREYRKRTGNHSSLTVPNKSLLSAGYHILQEIGRGNQCTALLGKDRGGQHYCVKAFEKARISTADEAGMKDEYEMLKGIASHPNIPKVFDIFQDGQFYYMVQAFYEGGDFTTLTQRTATTLMTQSWWRHVFKQCFQGLAHLHGNALMHCDIKESNLMLKRPQYHCPEIVIIDFGLMQTAATDSTMICGTPGYIPPEVWETANWYPGGDMFSLGVVIMQMLLDSVPPHHNPPQCEVLPGGIFTKGANTIHEAALVAKTRDPPFESMPRALQGLTKLTRSLLDKDVQKRPSAQRVLRDDWFGHASGQQITQVSDSSDAPFSYRLSEIIFDFFS